MTLNLICDVPGSRTCGSYLNWCKQSARLTKTQGFNQLPCMFFSPYFFPGEDDDDEECGEEKLPSCFDYVMHFLTVFWKVLFAFVPPTEYWNGWACFVVSICMIGLLTAMIGKTLNILRD